MSFGGAPSVAPAPAPKPLPAAPRPEAPKAVTAQIIETQKQKRRKGYQSTILTGALGFGGGALGFGGGASESPTSKKRLLGE